MSWESPNAADTQTTQTSCYSTSTSTSSGTGTGTPSPPDTAVPSSPHPPTSIGIADPNSLSVLFPSLSPAGISQSSEATTRESKTTRHFCSPCVHSGLVPSAELRHHCQFETGMAETKLALHSDGSSEKFDQSDKRPYQYHTYIHTSDYVNVRMNLCIF